MFTDEFKHIDPEYDNLDKNIETNQDGLLLTGIRESKDFEVFSTIFSCSKEEKAEIKNPFKNLNEALLKNSVENYDFCSVLSPRSSKKYSSPGCSISDK